MHQHSFFGHLFVQVTHSLTRCITALHTKGAPGTLFVMVMTMVLVMPIMVIRWSAHPLPSRPSDGPLSPPALTSHTFVIQSLPHPL